MANHRVGEIGFSESGPSNPALAYGVHGMPAAANFFDQEGSAYFGELEEALMQGVVGIRADGDRKPFQLAAAARPPPTLEIFPSWPMRFQQATQGNSQSAESTDSGSAQNTTVSAQLDSDSPVSRRSSSAGGHPPEQTQQAMASDVSRTGAATASTPHHPKPQEKRKLTDKDGKPLDAKTLRRLAQNREAAKKSRLRKKAYVQQLETSRVKLSQLEQDLQRARSQGLFLGGGGGAAGTLSSGAAMFDMEYARWLDEDQKHMTKLRGALQAHLPDSDLRVVVDECLTHYDDVFQLKAAAAKSDVFHLITGMWTSPAERCFLWMGGFRPSEMLKILSPQLDPLTEQQVMGIYSLQQSSLQAEDALTQGFEQLQQSLADTVAAGSLADGATDVANYMGQMAAALGKLSNLEGFVRQADNLRQETLHQLCRILTIRQSARCFLVIGEYHNRLRALSSLWASRRRENMMADEAAPCPTTTDLQMVHQPLQNHFSPF